VNERPVLALNDPALARGFSSLGVRLVPEGIIPRGAAGAVIAGGEAVALAGGPLAFDRVRLVWRQDEAAKECVASLVSVRDWAERTGDAAAFEVALGAIARERAAFAGFDPGRPAIVGVLNVTPDSFSDGGCFDTARKAIDRGRAMIDAGAQMIDVGGESTRPGADPVPIAEQLRRVLPVIDALAPHTVISVDTRSAEVLRAALAAGAKVMNDVSALTADPVALETVAETGCPVILMHSRGTPRTMQQNPRYRDVRLDIYDFLEARVAACIEGGIAPNKIAVDPGIGFGQNDVHISLLMRDVAILHGLGCPVMLGASRKSFIGRIDREAPAHSRLPGSLAAALHGVDRGIQLLRVHDVAETRQALAVWSHLGR
jgi:dihydropteroate synthase